MPNRIQSDSSESEKSRSENASRLIDFLSNNGAYGFEFAGSQADLSIKYDITELQDVALVSIQTRTASKVSYKPVDWVRQIYWTRGTATISVSQKETEKDGRLLGVIIPQDVPWQLSHSDNFDSLTLRIRQSALDRILPSLIGSGLSAPIQFEQLANEDALRDSMLRSAVFRFATDLNHPTWNFSPLAQAEFEHALIVRFLLCNRHNYSRFFSTDEPAVGDSRLRRIEEYIAANWDQPLDTATLAAIAGTSARTLFRDFQKKHRHSPHAFAKRIRLDKAQAMLMNSTETESVISIALKCGFQSLGHFAKAYRIRFGELPSKTLRHRRLPSGIKQLP